MPRYGYVIEVAAPARRASLKRTVNRRMEEKMETSVNFVIKIRAEFYYLFGLNCTYLSGYLLKANCNWKMLWNGNECGEK